MANEIISYLEMCQRESASLQRGMNFGIGGSYSVLLMSRRPNAHYDDVVEENGSILIYEGHDRSQTQTGPSSKTIDQPRRTPSGKLTQNGLFEEAAIEFKAGHRAAETVRVYEKIREGIWSFNGLFQLIDVWTEDTGIRSVFKFKLLATPDPSETADDTNPTPVRSRIIPQSVKLEVWKRDHGKCVQCGASDELHFDHDLPFSLGGTSLTAANVQLLCARHNLSKNNRIR